MNEKIVGIPNFVPDPQQEAERKLAILDSGVRRDFGTGAVRDCGDGKGRCDLLPLDIIAGVFRGHAGAADVFDALNDFVRYRSSERIQQVIISFIVERWGNLSTGVLELSRHYEDGAKKYAERNWENGIPLHCYVDSATRHYLKYLRKDDDEPHDRAFVWNLCGLLWTFKHHAELDDLPKEEQ